jgi:glycosyltransferase involved in cell wall biosynthesis
MPKVEVLYLSAVSSPSEFLRMKNSRRPGVQEVTYGMIESGFKFHTLIQKGLVADPDVNVLSLVGRSIHPRFYQGRFWQRKREVLAPNLIIDHLATPNIRIVKQAWLAVSFFGAVMKWRFQTRGSADRVLIADAAYISALPSIMIALAGSNVKKVAIFADVYSYMAPVADANHRRSLLHRVLATGVPTIYNRLDGFILLTEQMNPIVNPLDKPHMIMEGLVDSEMGDVVNRLEEKAKHPTILYAGALRKEYGLDSLVEGFRSYDNPEARLVVFGGGDYAAAVQEASTQDSRVSFGGTVPIADVVGEESRAWIVVNPRPVDPEFAKLSFPSKNMEYLSTGTAVLTTRLPGMPAEYLDYVLTIDSPGPEGVREALEKSFSMSATELHALGASGKQFVLEAKNNRAQAQRILNFVSTC